LTQPRRLPRLPRLRWLLVLLPPAIVAAIGLLTDTVLDRLLEPPWDTFAVMLTVLAIGIVVAVLTWGRIETLTIALSVRNEELEARGASARALNRVSVAIAALTDVDLILSAVVTHARDLLYADVALLLLEGPDGRLEPRAAVGAPGALLANPPADRVAAGRRPETNPADAMLPFVDPAHAVVRLAAPLQRGGLTIGLLAIGTAVPRGFDADEVETLASLANQATIALEHDRLQARLRELAVVEERERIARELHDGIAQVLGYVNTKSQAVDGFLEAGRVDEARIQLAELGSAARAVYVDVRESILGLRGPIEPGQGLGTAVAAHARRVAAESRFALEVAIDEEAATLRLDPAAEANLYRIAQEALTNVRKHARARHVRLAMGIGDARLRLAIEDDGVGLGAPGRPTDKPGYGLRAMHERAAAIGAEVEVANRDTGGVAVRVSLPLADHVRPGADAPVPAPVGASVGSAPG
jgi:signal transduction histidine kinase